MRDEATPLASLLQAIVPVLPTPLVGRSKEVAELCHLVQNAARLVTVTGQGGVGKTRCAAVAAEHLAPQFADGVVVIALAGVQDAALLPALTAQALRLRSTGEPRQQVLDVLSTRRALVLFDNFEHLMDGAPFLADILRSAPDVRVLVTSRAPLHLSGEQELHVQPLVVPHSTDPEVLGQSPAVQLFVQSARRVVPGFSLSDDNAPAVQRIIQLLGGLPLALDLAAARLRLLSPAALLERLDLTVLSGGARDLPGRHQTLRATLDWSYGLLPDSAQRLFTQLGVFPDSFTLTAVSRVAGCDVLETLGSLVEHGLVFRQGEDRFNMLEPVREYAREHLAELDLEGRSAAWAAHAAYYASLAREAEPALRTEAQQRWLDRLSAEAPHWRAALQWAVENGQVAVAVELCDGLWHYWWIHQPTEGRRWSEAVLALQHSTPTQHARALLVLASMAYVQGDYPTAERAAGDAQNLLSQAALPVLPVRARLLCGASLANQGRMEQGLALLREAVRLAEPTEDDWCRGFAHTGLGRALAQHGELLEAVRHLERGMVHYRAAGTWSSGGYAATVLAALYLETGRRTEALATLQEALRHTFTIGDDGVMAYALAGTAAVLATVDPTTAAVLWGAAERLWRKVGVTPVPGHLAWHAPHLAQTQAVLGHEYAPAVARGGTVPVSAALELALQADLTVGGRSARTPPAPGGDAFTLTARERQVLRLLTDGLTNPQIAAALCVSTTTVHSHVRSVFSKLGVSTRAAATRIAVEQGIA